MNTLQLSDAVRNQISNPRPDAEKLAAVIQGEAKPNKVHLGELIINNGVIQWVMENVLEREWVPLPEDGNREQMKRHLLCLVEYWYRMGYDYIRISGGLAFPIKQAEGRGSWADEHSGMISNWEEFEQYKWPEVQEEDLWHYEFVADNLPGGMGMMVCPTSGFLEMPMNYLFGIENLSLLLFDQPDLVEEVFNRVRKAILDTYARLVEFPKVMGIFQGDDMGYKASTMFSPEFLKKHSLPGHQQAARMAHEKNLIYILHSCGNLSGIMDYLIEDIHIDAKHSYEDVIEPVESIFDKYGGRIGIVGGIDLNYLAGGSEEDVRGRTRQVLEHCMPGRYLLGSGNSISGYCKPENVLAMYDEAYQFM
jgi:uroporphyrinogen decarboxylase